MHRKYLAVLLVVGWAFASWGQHHSADTSEDGRLSLGEALRVVQLYNAGIFSCLASSEDGYQPGGAGLISCTPHATDYLPQDWRLNLSELLRVLQLYNAGHYHACPAGEDGYCYGPAPEEGEGDGDGTSEGALEGEGGSEGEGAEEGEGTADGEGSVEGVVEGDGEGDPIEQFILTYRADTGGRIEGLTEQTVAPGGDGVAVQVVPYTGFSFIEWSDGSTDNPRWDIQVAGDIDVTANFLHTPDMIPVPAGDFPMGAPDTGADQTFGEPQERPVHTVTLSAYEIGKYEVTNEQYCRFLNWALDSQRNLLRTAEDDTWNDSGEIYAGESLKLIYQFADGWREYSDIQLENSKFITRYRGGFPEGTMYDTADLPVVQLTWYGAVLYCNYLSVMNDLDAVYDTETWEADFSKNGFHLPTEAQWERAAAWDGSQRFAYAHSSNLAPGLDEVNIGRSGQGLSNPLGFPSLPGTATGPYSSPVGWFNGINISPNRNLPTKLSVSPIGAFDMSGNVHEMCHDRFGTNYYTTGGPPWLDPSGPTEFEGSGPGELGHVARGGAFNADSSQGRAAARRNTGQFDYHGFELGFRLAR